MLRALSVENRKIILVYARIRLIWCEIKYILTDIASSDTNYSDYSKVTKNDNIPTQNDKKQAVFIWGIVSDMLLHVFL